MIGFCCQGLSEIPSVLFHFLVVKQTKSHNMLFIPDPKIKQLVSCKIMVSCKVVIFFSGFGMDCFVSSSEGNYSNLCSVENLFDYTVSILYYFKIPASRVLRLLGISGSSLDLRTEFSYSLQIFKK